MIVRRRLCHHHHLGRTALIVLLHAAGLALAQSPEADADVGRGVFRIYCSPCHGLKARGGRGPDLTRGLVASGAPDDEIFRVISNGVAGTEMAPFGGTLSDDSIRRIIAFLRSLERQNPPQPVPGDAKNGEQLFWNKGQCGACHRVGAKGGGAGPDLSRIGRQRSPEYIRKAIVDPDADILPGYRTLAVVTRAGQRIEGIERGFDNFTAQLVDLSGNFYSFERSAVTSISRENRSLMPSYKDRLTAAELQDLVAYLAALSGVEARK
jgi:putative heme-binding domain-containing protein